MSVRFEWDGQKAASNLGKHEVSFDEAITVFDDPLARIFDDPHQSLEEHREMWLAILSMAVCCWSVSMNELQK
ncbi:MAG: hypothetical protein JWM21_4886 [Acidobacteria bacterium]|nr:hypothetical protein [Acidobacteriota bacterium]